MICVRQEPERPTISSGLLRETLKVWTATASKTRAVDVGVVRGVVKGVDGFPMDVVVMVEDELATVLKEVAGAMMMMLAWLDSTAPSPNAVGDPFDGQVPQEGEADPKT